MNGVREDFSRVDPEYQLLVHLHLRHCEIIAGLQLTQDDSLRGEML